MDSPRLILASVAAVWSRAEPRHPQSFAGPGSGFSNPMSYERTVLILPPLLRFAPNWGTWIRTMIHSSKGCCPTIRRSPNDSLEVAVLPLACPARDGPPMFLANQQAGLKHMEHSKKTRYVGVCIYAQRPQAHTTVHLRNHIHHPGSGRSRASLLARIPLSRHRPDIAFHCLTQSTLMDREPHAQIAKNPHFRGKGGKTHHRYHRPALA